MNDQGGVGRTTITRREFLAGTTLAGFSAFLAACTSAGGTAEPSTSASAAPSVGASAEPSSAAIEGPLNFANWPGYIDLTEDESSSPTLTDFEAKHGIKVNYVEDIQSNEDFFATLAPSLQAGLDTGWDLIVITDYMALRLVDAGWLEKIDPANTPTAAKNLRSALRGLAWDPDQTYHYPYQTFADGVGYNRKSTGRDLTSIADLFDPAFAGKATLINAYQDTFGLVSLLLRARGEITNIPPDLTPEDGQKIVDFLQPYVDNGHIRAFTGNEYLQDFGSGDTWVAIVFSGDLASSAGPDDVFVYPDEGSLIFNDNMLIPKGAVHKRAAEAMIEFLYDPAIAARLANWIYYISPVDGVAEEILKLDPEAASNPLLFPPPEVVEKQYGGLEVTPEEDIAFSEQMAQLMGA
jgi:spermidine/putrescine transport system substrate-binding protein